MNIIATEYNLNQEATEVYLAGCTRKCPGCHNLHTWDFSLGQPWREWVEERYLKQRLKMPLTNKIWIMGGEPLDQDLNELEALLDLCMETGVDVWLWTSYELDEVPDRILLRCGVIKTGRYMADIPGYTDQKTSITLASGNQRITRV